jgi:hypothetical protein
MGIVVEVISQLEKAAITKEALEVRTDSSYFYFIFALLHNTDRIVLNLNL